MTLSLLERDPRGDVSGGRVTECSRCLAKKLQSSIRRQPWLGAGSWSKGKHEAGRFGFPTRAYIKRQVRRALEKALESRKRGME